MENERTCCQCKKTLHVTDFATTKSRYCKPCWSDYCRARHERLAQDPDYRAHQAAKMRAWRAAHPGHKPISGERAAYVERVKAGPTKFCATCGETKPRSEFGRLKAGWRSRCNSCHARIAAERYAKLKNDPEWRAMNAAKTREWVGRNPDRSKALKRLYATGWTAEAFDKEWEKQDGKCAICRIEMKRVGRGANGVQADHDHQSKKPRALVCHHCNTGMGAFGDSPERLEAAAAYIRSFR
jgi:hypothetical protein